MPWPYGGNVPGLGPGFKFAIKLVCFFILFPIHWQATNILLYLVVYLFEYPTVWFRVLIKLVRIFSCCSCPHNSTVRINSFFVLLALVITFFGLAYFLFKTFICPFTIAISLFFFQHWSVYLVILMSILTSSTINATSSIHIHHTQHKAAPLTLTQKKEKAAQREENQAAINTAIDEWFSSTTAKANKLAAHFNKKPCYFLNIFFHGGAHMVYHHKKINPHNAFMSLKAQEL